ncbi:hypothetical protein EXIGLDRAFT_731424 [Exidia glandulosa HHB12029]|uniref:Protein PNS1 n=1 Tax=Exidia glandulosa HHB12029 TaxID=1314781 RepID=A0A165BVL6_EXIGL|nr:hypothetical protein EXIGLDRAFT_731424 [Exidia glandulosa HHB12029]
MPAAPFSQYASKFLNASFAQPAASSMTTSQPLFYSFTDQSERDDMAESRDLDDDDDPHLRRSSKATLDQSQGYDIDDDILNPFQDDAPLIPSEPRPQSGWLAHVHRPASPAQSMASSSSDSRSIEGPPDDFFADAHTRTNLRESLLPRDGISRSVFSLPDPRRVPLRKYNDPAWTVLYCTSLSAVLVGSIVVFFVTRPNPSHDGPFPYATLKHTVPLLTILTLSSALASYAHVFLLRLAVRPVLLATAIFIPCALFFAAVWAFAGSFVWDGSEGTWGETVGLRIFSLVPLISAVLSARSLLARRKQLEQTINVVELSTTILLAHPPLFVLSPAILFACMLLSLPILSLVFRLFLVGYWGGSAGSWEWHLKTYAGWLIAAVTLFWLWTWTIARGILRVTSAGVVGHWYFQRPSPQATPNPDADEAMTTTTAALFRATGPSFGSVAVAALFLSAARALGLATLVVYRVTTPPAVPPMFNPLVIPLRLLGNLLRSLSNFALVYVGLTGEAFFPAARRARALTSIRRPIARSDYTVLSTLLLLSAAAAGTLSALGTYLFVAHTLSAPGSAPFSAWLAGAVTFLVAWYSVGLVDDIADTLYVCYCLERDSGSEICREAFAAFEGGQHHNGVPNAATPSP